MIKKNLYFILIPLLIQTEAYSAQLSFKEAMLKLKKHPSIEELNQYSQKMDNEASLKGSWGDPKFKIAAKNFPSKSLSDSKTPMTGVEYTIGQSIPLSTKHTDLKSSFNSKARAIKHQAQKSNESLKVSVWKYLILNRRLLEEKQILKENLNWLDKNLKVSKKLYSNGRTSQHAILEIQIRRSQIEIGLSNKNFEIQKIKDQLKYLLNSDTIKTSSVPWNILKTKKANTSNTKDFKSLSFKAELTGSEYAVGAAKKSFVPDIDLSISYTKRNSLDEQGDFLGASIAFSLPFSSIKHSAHQVAVNQNYKIKHAFKKYQIEKTRELELIQKDLNKLSAEIKILETKTIVFAKNSRKIAAKSYGLGNSTYLELLQSELTLQNLLLEKVLLKAKKDYAIVKYKYIRGEALNE